MEITKATLHMTHYRWGEQDSSWTHHEWEQLFRRDEGSHVVGVLQKACDALRLSCPRDVHILEELIASELPCGSVSRHDAFLWVYVEYKKRVYRQLN